MFWGAVGGTIPDLDIITKPLMTEVESLAFHRGISHSFFFSVVGGLLFGWLIYKLYQSPYSKAILKGILSLFLSCIPLSIVYFLFGNDWSPYAVAAAAILVAGGIFMLIKKENDLKEVTTEQPGLRSWQLMFFLAFLTHILLDAFTMYGTQLLLPFSDYRAAIASISVADPVFYTIPFIIFLVLASRYSRKDSKRQFWTWMGISLSTLYLLFTMWNKQRINQVYEDQMVQQNIMYDRYITGPTIFNNFLWNCTAETQDAYYVGQYSVFDTSPIEFMRIEKQHELLTQSSSDETINTLRWFSDDFYSVIRRQDGLLQINDLRFGTFRNTGSENDFIFRFVVEQQPDGSYEMYETIGGPDEDETAGIFLELWERIKGV